MEVALRATVRRLRELSVRRMALGAATFAVALGLGLALHSRVPWLIFAVSGLPGAIRDGARQRSVVASRAGLKIDGAFFERRQLLNAFGYDARERTWLRVEIDDGAIEIEAETADAEKLTIALGVDPSASAFEMRVLRAHRVPGWLALFTILAGVIALYTAAASGHFALFGAALVALLLGGGAFDGKLRRVTMVAGIDGLAIVGRRGVELLPWDSVTGARAERRTLVVIVAGRGELRFDAFAAGSGRADARAATLFERIERARRNWKEARDPGPLLEAGAGAFRRAHLPPDVLWDALRNGKTPASQRVLVAATLRQNATDEDLARLREAAASLAPPARAALVRMLDAPEEALDRTVEELVSIAPR